MRSPFFKIADKKPREPARADPGEAKGRFGWMRMFSVGRRRRGGGETAEPVETAETGGTGEGGDGSGGGKAG